MVIYMEILIATSNLHKIMEIKNIFKDYNIKIISLLDVGFKDEIIENGQTFKENAYIKAKTIYDIYHMNVIADDSGLEVIALDLKPGVYSHRYSASGLDKDNNELLLKNMKGITNRKAHFKTSLCFISKDKTIYTEGILEGEILEAPRGENGFGYDPLMYIEEYHKTVAEMTMEEKNNISHRSKAFNNMIKELLKNEIISRI